MGENALQQIQNKIYIIRNKKIMLDSDLAELYRVETRVLNQAVKRNISRFPEDFMFQFNDQELNDWKSQFVISNPNAKMGLRKKPYAFTEQGVSMLSSVLNSQTAIQVNIQIMRVFVKLREISVESKSIQNRLMELEKKSLKYDKDIASIFEAIRQLLGLQDEEKKKKKKIGF